MNKVQILVIEDDIAVGNLITTTLEMENYQFRLAKTAKQGIMNVLSYNPDIMLLDLGLPDMDGLEVIKKVRSWSNIPIIVVSARSEDQDKVKALDLGADDYLTKPFDMDELIARIVSLIRRYTRFNGQDGTPQQLDFDGLKIDLENRSITTVNGTFELPPKEFDLLLFCAKNQGKILTKQRIYEEVWGEEYFYDDSNIMAIISRLRKKIEANPGSPKYIQTIKGIGYRFNKEV